ncbi:endonuclease domain-containing protein, partial [Actinacidiphila yeochonensis]|uniref:endonuclease domain-containing protein n=1 Tax=Actinacidiphila yeochonensis TaxID=89050 RepID=UPI002244F859
MAGPPYPATAVRADVERRAGPAAAAAPDCELCVRRESAAVDHDAGTGRVRGVLCRSCNSWLGSMEAALCVPRNRMQTQAAYLHWRFEAGGTAALAWYRGGAVLSGPERAGVRGRPAPGAPAAGR